MDRPLKNRGCTGVAARLSRAVRGALAVLALLLALSAASAAESELPPTRFKTVQLANGLRAYLVVKRDAPVISVQVWYHVGSKNETAGKTGFAHLFEHLMFQGTTNVPPEQFSTYVVRAGGLDNAYTTEDFTVYWETVPSSLLPVVLWLEADRMRNLDISEKIFRNEREVVKEERRMRFENPPYGTVVETLYRLAFTVHGYAHTPIGSMEDLDRATLSDIQEFYDTYYVPQNAVLVITGDYDAAEAEALVERYFGPLSGRPSAKAQPVPPEPPQTSKRILKITRNVALPAYIAGYHMPADGTADAYPLRIAARILSDGESARIPRRLVYEKQMALQAESDGNFSEDPNLFFVFAVLNEGFSPAQAAVVIQAELDRLKTEPVPEAELVKGKNQILRDFVLSRQSTQSLGEELGYAAIVLKDPGLLDTELDRFMNVTAQDIQRVARKYFVPENLSVVEVYPAESGLPAGSQGVE